MNVIEFNPLLKQSKSLKPEYLDENNLSMEKANLLDIIIPILFTIKILVLRI